MPCIYTDALQNVCGANQLVPGSNYCAVHFGRIHNSSDVIKEVRPTNGRGPRLTEGYKGFYFNRMGPRLKALVEAQRNNGKINDISEEIEITRAANAAAVDVLETTMSLQESQEAIMALGGGCDDAALERGRAKLAEMQHNAAAAVKSAMRENAKLVETAAKITSLTVDRLAPNAIEGIIQQFMAFVHIVFGDDMSKIEELDRLIAEKMQLPSVIGNMGTTISPSQEVVAMDNTVPRWVEPEEETK